MSVHRTDAGTERDRKKDGEQCYLAVDVMSSWNGSGMRRREIGSTAMYSIVRLVGEKKREM